MGKHTHGYISSSVHMFNWFDSIAKQRWLEITIS